GSYRSCGRFAVAIVVAIVAAIVVAIARSACCLRLRALAGAPSGAMHVAGVPKGIARERAPTEAAEDAPSPSRAAFTLAPLCSCRSAFRRDARRDRAEKHRP
ncbi:MAG TPA: hypothetical protein PKC03_16795, partial [Dokdonella sp.]|nr:hypothetical protein [Dokdonella sp.]